MDLCGGLAVVDGVALAVVPGDAVCAEGLGDDAEDHGELVEDYFGCAEVVVRIEDV